MYVTKWGHHLWKLWTPSLSNAQGRYFLSTKYYAAYCNHCHQYFRHKCKCCVPHVLIQSTGEVL